MESNRAPWRVLLDGVRGSIQRLADGDPKTTAQIRRWISKQLMYDERGNPTECRVKKARLFERQKGLCGICGEPLQMKRSELHRTKEAWRWYVVDGPDTNTVLVHKGCHDQQQEERGYR